MTYLTLTLLFSLSSSFCKSSCPSRSDRIALATTDVSEDPASPTSRSTTSAPPNSTTRLVVTCLFYSSSCRCGLNLFPFLSSGCCFSRKHTCTMFYQISKFCTYKTNATSTRFRKFLQNSVRLSVSSTVHRSQTN